MASALFKLSSDNGSNYLAAGTAMADANALAYVASGTYSMKAALDSTSGVSAVAWAITSADDAHAASLPTVTTAGDKTCTFSVPKTGGAWLLRCTINGGVDAQGNADTSLVKSLAIKVLNSNSQQEIAVGEVDEAGTYGWTKAFNDVSRTAGAGATGTLSGMLYALALDGARTDAVNTSLAAPIAVTNWTVNAAVSVRAAYPAQATGTVTLAAGASIHNDGNAGTNNSQTAGGTTGIAGGFTSSAYGGGAGGASGATGTAGTAATSNSFGGAGGGGGTGSKAGGSGGAVTLPTRLSTGRFFFDFMRFSIGNSFYQASGGAGGGGGGGGAAVVGSGGGGGAGILQLCAHRLVLGAGATISCRGGVGGNNTLGGGGGGGGGGGFCVVIVDELEMPGGAAYADHFKVDGGTGGTVSGGGTAGTDGSRGKLVVIVAGEVVYELA